MKTFMITLLLTTSLAHAQRLARDPEGRESSAVARLGNGRDIEMADSWPLYQREVICMSDLPGQPGSCIEAPNITTKVHQGVIVVDAQGSAPDNAYTGPGIRDFHWQIRFNPATDTVTSTVGWEGVEAQPVPTILSTRFKVRSILGAHSRDKGAELLTQWVTDFPTLVNLAEFLAVSVPYVRLDREVEPTDRLTKDQALANLRFVAKRMGQLKPSELVSKHRSYGYFFNPPGVIDLLLDSCAPDREVLELIAPLCRGLRGTVHTDDGWRSRRDTALFERETTCRFQ
jgi:hypothetical protein